MSFRKRNVIPPQPRSSTLISGEVGKFSVNGTRPSPLDGRSTISTGTKSFDSILAGHAGLPLGTAILVEESGSTDFGGVLLRYYAAEGLVQGHHVHVLGVTEAWGRELPGLTDAPRESLSASEQIDETGDKMKIAWRYERLGEFRRERGPLLFSSSKNNDSTNIAIFCHSFDLSKRLLTPSPSLLNFVSHTPHRTFDSELSQRSESIFNRFLRHLVLALSANPPSAIHRVVIPSLLSPAIYENGASAPEYVLRFFHSLRALLRKYPKQLTALITLPISLYPRTTGLTRWMESLSDGLIELTPFPSQPTAVSVDSPKAVTGQGDLPQGMLKVHQSPILHERGGGSGGVVDLSSSGDDLTFILSRRKGIVIKPFNLPPVDGEEYYAETGDVRRSTKSDIEF